MEDRMSEYLIDETEPPSDDEARAARSRPHGFEEAEQYPIAVALREMRILDTKKWFGEAEIRLDAFVVTAASGDTAYTPGTFTFPQIRDGDQLQIGESGLPLYMGHPRGLLDISIVASRAQEDNTSLAQLIAQAGDDVASLLGQITKLTAAAPHVAVISAAGGAAVKLSTVVLRLLQEFTGTSIGLYRNAWWEYRDNFGIGRHPDDGTWYRKNDLEFRYEIFRNEPLQ